MISLKLWQSIYVRQSTIVNVVYDIYGENICLVLLFYCYFTDRTYVLFVGVLPNS